MKRTTVAERSSLGRRLFIQSAGNFGLNCAIFLSGFLIALVLSRLLGPAGYGTYAFAIAWATILAVPAVLGLPSLLVREIATYRVRADWPRAGGLIRRANQAVFFASLSVCGLAAAIFWGLDWPNPPFFGPTLLALAFVPVFALVSVRQSLMLGFGRVVLGRAPEALVLPSLTIVLALVLDRLLAHGLSASWAVGASVMAAALTAALGVLLLRRVRPRELREAEPIDETRVWMIATLPLFLSAGISVVNAQAGAILTGAIAGSHEAGIYSVAVRAAGFVPFLLIAALPPLMPTIAELHERGENEKLQRLLKRGAQAVFLGSLPIVIGVLVFAGHVLALFGSGFAGGVGPLRILCVGQLVNVATGLAGMILVMTGEAGQATWAWALGTAANLGLAAALIPPYGAGGAAVATSASMIFTNVLMAALLWRRRGIYSAALRLGRSAS